MRPFDNGTSPSGDGDDAESARPRLWRVTTARTTTTVPAGLAGRLVHEALALWRFPDPGFDDWVKARARAYGLIDEDQLADAGRRAAELLDRFRAHPLYRELVAAERRLHEVPYSYVVDGRVESGSIDAVYRHGGRWTVVDFKTELPSPEFAFLIRMVG